MENSGKFIGDMLTRKEGDIAKGFIGDMLTRKEGDIAKGVVGINNTKRTDFVDTFVKELLAFNAENQNEIMLEIIVRFRNYRAAAEKNADETLAKTKEANKVFARMADIVAEAERTPF